MTCKMCRERGETWPGDDYKCAFEHGDFNTANWHCATMNALRERAEELGTTFRDNNAAGSIGYVPFEGDDYSGYIVMTWHKNRGHTGFAQIMSDDNWPRPLTEKEALEALAYSERWVRGDAADRQRPNG